MAGECEAARRKAEALHDLLKEWWADAAHLESQGKKVPARKLRERMQTISTHARGILEALPKD